MHIIVTLHDENSKLEITTLRDPPVIPRIGELLQTIKGSYEITSVSHAATQDSENEDIICWSVSLLGSRIGD